MPLVCLKVFLKFHSWCLCFGLENTEVFSILDNVHGKHAFRWLLNYLKILVSLVLRWLSFRCRLVQWCREGFSVLPSVVYSTRWDASLVSCSRMLCEVSWSGPVLHAVMVLVAFLVLAHLSKRQHLINLLRWHSCVSFTSLVSCLSSPKHSYLATDSLDWSIMNQTVFYIYLFSLS